MHFTYIYIYKYFEIKFKCEKSANKHSMHYNLYTMDLHE